MAEEFFSFEKALEKLKLREEELRRLVSEGEIRAYRSGETMKLRREDVEKLQKELTVPGGGEVVDLEGGTEELIFSEEEPAEVVEETGMETAQISEEDTLMVEEVRPAKATEVELEEVEETVVTPVARRGAKPARTQSSAPVLVESSNEGTMNRVFLIGTAAVLLVGLFAVVNASAVEHSGAWNFFKSIGSSFHN